PDLNRTLSPTERASLDRGSPAPLLWTTCCLHPSSRPTDPNLTGWSDRRATPAGSDRPRAAHPSDSPVAVSETVRPAAPPGADSPQCPGYSLPTCRDPADARLRAALFLTTA